MRIATRQPARRSSRRLAGRTGGARSECHVSASQVEFACGMPRAESAQQNEIDDAGQNAGGTFEANARNPCRPPRMRDVIGALFQLDDGTMFIVGTVARREFAFIAAEKT